MEYINSRKKLASSLKLSLTSRRKMPAKKSGNATRKSYQTARLHKQHFSNNFLDQSLLRKLIDVSSDAVFVVCNEHITFANPAAQQMLAANDQRKIVDEKCVNFAQIGARRTLQEKMEEAAHSGEAIFMTHQQWRRTDGKPIIVDILILACQWHGCAALFVVARDTSEQRQLERTRRSAEERLRRAIDAASTGTWDWDIANNLISWNEWHYRLLGLEPTGGFQNYESFISCVHPDDRDPLSSALMSALQSGHEFHFAFRVVWGDGSLRWLRSRGRVVDRDARGHARHMSGVALDVTEQFLAREALQHSLDEMEFRVRERTLELTQLNEQYQTEIAQRQQLEIVRRELMQRLVTSQEDERLRISHELHDQMGQNLVALMMGLKTLPEAGVPRFMERMHHLQGLTALLMEQVHSLAWELRPAELDNLGLEVALSHYVKQWQKSHGVAAEFLSNGLKSEKRLPSHLETAFYRAVQEALTNVSKHAKARRVAVLLEKRGEQIVAVIEDDGIGFDVDAKEPRTQVISLQSAINQLTDVSSRQRLGLIGMQERLNLIGGSVEIESAPDKGTSIFLRAPIK